MTGLLPVPPAMSGARELVAAIAAGRMTAEAAARSIIERIAELEPRIGAWHLFEPERLLEAARRLDRGPILGSLHGLPVGIKDVIDTADLATGYGSALYEGVRPAADASCVALLRHAGGLVAGKTVSTEFAFVAPGRTRHPEHPEHTPGGSSSGSAAAVAAGMVPAALGTQTSGSTIRPAAFCGVVGYKPSFGLIARAGIKPLADSLDTLGLFARSVGDVALLAAELAGRPGFAAAQAHSGPRLAVFPTPFTGQATPDALAAFQAALSRLQSAGASLASLDDPDDFASLLQAHETVMRWELPLSLAHERRVDGGRLRPQTRAGIAPDPSLDAAGYDRALAIARRARGRWSLALEPFDALVTLAAAGEAPHGLGSTGNPVFNRGWTQLRLPCITVPAGRGGAGLPLGLQLVGRAGDDARLLQVAMLAEAALVALKF